MTRKSGTLDRRLAAAKAAGRWEHALSLELDAAVIHEEEKRRMSETMNGLTSMLEQESFREAYDASPEVRGAYDRLSIALLQHTCTDPAEHIAQVRDDAEATLREADALEREMERKTTSDEEARAKVDAFLADEGTMTADEVNALPAAERERFFEGMTAVVEDMLKKRLVPSDETVKRMKRATEGLDSGEALAALMFAAGDCVAGAPRDQVWNLITVMRLWLETTETHATEYVGPEPAKPKKVGREPDLAPPRSAPWNRCNETETPSLQLATENGDVLQIEGIALKDSELWVALRPLSLVAEVDGRKCSLPAQAVPSHCWPERWTSPVVLEGNLNAGALRIEPELPF